MAVIVWFTTSPNPRVLDTGYDAGQRGWRVHAVLMPNDEKSKIAMQRIRRFQSKALCGLTPAHGWGLDLFIDEPCARCLKAMEKRRLTELKQIE